MSRLITVAILLAFSAPLVAQKLPAVVPARIGSQNDDLFIMTLGDAETPLADARFDTENDRLTLSNGRVIENYYRDSLHIRFYSPIEKSVFPLPPSGWCSWYFYYQEISSDEILRNAEWISRNLMDFGARVVQIDDGWQGRGHGGGDNRDWTTIDERFPGGMKNLASQIRKLGLTPGLWLAPHGQSNRSVVKNNPGVFLLQHDTSASKTWEGLYLVDPSTPSAHSYLQSLFTTLSKWGYDYFKIDGQPVVLDEYGKKHDLFAHPSANSDSLYRSTLMSIRSAIGGNRYLLGCWGIPLQGSGIMNGSRTGGDVVLGWSGFREALSTTMKWYFLHNFVWYCDPDVMLLRSPLSLDQARAWATLFGMTGQALMASDRLPDLPDERVEILRSVFPAVDIRPLDLFPSHRDKHIWDLKVNHLHEPYDVVAAFNFDEDRVRSTFIGWKDLGLEEGALIHVFDFWNKEYLGAWEKGIALTIPPTSCRVLSLVPVRRSIQLVSTSRHITQGWVDVESASFDSVALIYRGTSRVVGKIPYELRFAFERGRNFRVSSAAAIGAQKSFSNHQGWASVRFIPPKTGRIDWMVEFEPAPTYRFRPGRPEDLAVEPLGLDGVTVRWSDDYYLNCGYQVRLNGDLLGYTTTNSFPIRGISLDSSYNISVNSVWQDGTSGARSAEIRFTARDILPDEIYLSDLEPSTATAGWGSVRMDRSVAGNLIRVGGVSYGRGIGTHANSEIVFNLHGIFSRFRASVGIDDEVGNAAGASVEFWVMGDGKILWQSGVKKRTDKPSVCDIPLPNVRRLVLKVSDAGDGIDYDHADWADARVFRIAGSPPADTTRGLR